MQTTRVFYSGQVIEIWDDPATPFGCDRESLERYAASGDWVMLFNALVLLASRSPGAVC
jgi:hypothetical protein